MNAMSLSKTTALDLEALLDVFRADAAALGARRDVDEVFAELCAAYQDESRKYHSLEHIAECLGMLAELRETLESPAEVALAIWFHDAVYATHPFASSEKRSAALAQKSCMRMGIGEPSAQRIAAMVRATKDHDPSSIAGSVHERDASALFDIDLAILGSDPVRYARFERDVRAKHAWVPEGIFRSRRAKLLGAFAARRAIYRTPILRERLEATARTNIERAVAELTATVDEVVLHPTDVHLFATRAARLEALHSWADLHFASILPGPSPRLGVAFAPDDDGALQIALDAPYASEVVDRVRSIPEYDRDAERRAETSGVPSFVYSRERHRPVAGPLRKAERRAAYRGQA
ncbi:MAG: hypothetical protein BGO98_11330 [Myxococcales bacterium 68-20]|nr:MAG: hypothetical protein BGO98_11330 [Myxococcales bacterium 68-20]